MKRVVYVPVDGSDVTVTPAEQMVKCGWCGIKICPPIPPVCPDPDDLVMHGNNRICVRCALRIGLVERQVVNG